MRKATAWMTAIATSLFMTALNLHAAIEGQSVSDLRRAAAEREAKSVCDEGLDCTQGVVKREILRRVTTELSCPDYPVNTLDSTTYAAMKKKALAESARVMGKTAKAYYIEARARIDKENPPIKEGDKVDLLRRKGVERVHTVGTFRGFVQNSERIKIDFDTYPVGFFESRDIMRMVPEKREKMVTDLAKAEVASFQKRQAAVYEEVYERLKGDQRKKNEASGYVYDRPNWITLPEYVELCVAKKPKRALLEQYRDSEERNAAYESDVIKSSFATQVRDWILTAGGDAKSLDAVVGVSGIPWRARYGEVKVFTADFKNVKVDTDRISFDLKFDPYFQEESRVELCFYRGYLYAVTHKPLSPTTTLSAPRKIDSTTQALTRWYGQPYRLSSGINNSTLWRGKRAQVEIELLPIGEKVPERYSITVNPVDIIKKINEL